MKALAERILPASDDVVREFNAAFEKFYETFKGKFTGDVDKESAELLCEQAFFNEFWKEIDSLGLPATFQQVSQDLTKCAGIRFDDLTPEQHQKLQEVVQARISELQAEIASFDTSFTDRVKLLYVGPAREAIRDLVMRLPGFRK